MKGVTFFTMYQELSFLLSDDQITMNPSIREQHSHDESYHTPHLPVFVVFPQSKEEVAKILQYASTHKIPVVPFAVGSSLEGHAIPIRGGISLDMMRMNRILEIRPDDFLVHVEPGVTREELNEALKKYGLFFPVDPGANASIGGMVATNASGTTTVRYGAMKEQVRKLEVVLANGEIIDTGSLAIKSSSGYHLTELFIGSEGTLGVITGIWLRVYGIPESMVAARATFPTIEQCVATTTAIMGAGIPVARMELVDPAAMRGGNFYKKTSYPEVPTVFFEFHGSKESLEQDMERVKEIANDEGCNTFDVEKSEEERRRLWDARHVAATAFLSQYPGKKQIVTDVCLPLSELPGAVKKAHEWLEELDLPGGIVGHVGDGNFHTILAIDPDNQEDMQKAEDFNEKLVGDALKRGGTCTGEHGVGLGKMKYQADEHGSALLIMRAIKTLLDPYDIMNPGKLIDQ